MCISLVISSSTEKFSVPDLSFFSTELRPKSSPLLVTRPTLVTILLPNTGTPDAALRVDPILGFAIRVLQLPETVCVFILVQLLQEVFFYLTK